jgi:hypothetical protein
MARQVPIAILSLLLFAGTAAAATLPSLLEDPEEAVDVFSFDGTPYSWKLSTLPPYWRQAVSADDRARGSERDPQGRDMHGPRPSYEVVTVVNLDDSSRDLAPGGTKEAFPSGRKKCVHFGFAGTQRTAGDARPEDGMAIYRDPPYQLKKFHHYSLRGKVRVSVPADARVRDADAGAARGAARLGVCYLYREKNALPGVYQVWSASAGKFTPLTEWDAQKSENVWKAAAAVPEAGDVTPGIPLRPGDSGWQEVEMRLRPPLGTTHIQIVCEASGTEPKADIWFDSIQLLLRPTINIQTRLTPRAVQERRPNVYMPNETGWHTVILFNGLGSPEPGEFTTAISVTNPLEPERRLYLTPQETLTSKPVFWPVVLGAEALGAASLDVDLPIKSENGMQVTGSFVLAVELFQKGKPSTSNDTRIVLLPEAAAYAAREGPFEGIGVAINGADWSVDRSAWLLECLHSRWVAVPLWRDDFPQKGRPTGDDPLYRSLLSLGRRRIGGQPVQVTGGFYPLPGFLRNTRNPDTGGAEWQTIMNVLRQPPPGIDWLGTVGQTVEQYDSSVVREFLLEGETGPMSAAAEAGFRGKVRALHRGAFIFPAAMGSRRPAGLKAGDLVAWQLPQGIEFTGMAEGLFAMAETPQPEDVMVLRLPPAAAGDRARVEYVWKAVVLGRAEGFRRFLIDSADKAGPGLLAFGPPGIQGAPRPVLQHPDQSFVAVRTLNGLIAGARPAKPMFLPAADGVRNLVFFRAEAGGGERAMMAFWAEKPEEFWTRGGTASFTATIDLDADARVVDLFGNEVALEHPRKPGQATVRLAADRLPRFLLGLRSAIVRVENEIRITDRIRSQFRHQRVKLSFPNSFPEARKMRVTAEVLDGKGAPAVGWKIQPLWQETPDQVPSGKLASFEFEMRPPFTQEVDKDVPVRLTIETTTAVEDERTRKFSVTRMLRVFSPIAVEVDDYKISGKMLELRLRIGWNDAEEAADKTIGLDVWANAADTPQQRAHRKVLGLKNQKGYAAGERLYVALPDGWEDGARQIVIGAKEVDADQFLKKTETLAKKAP